MLPNFLRNNSAQLKTKHISEVSMERLQLRQHKDCCICLLYIFLTSTNENDLAVDCLGRESFQDCCNKGTRCIALPTPPSFVPLSPPLPDSRPFPIPTASKQTHRGWDVLKWDWRRAAECGRITGVCRQTADRERNWVGEQPPRGRSSTSRQMHCQLFAYSKWMTWSQLCWSRPKKEIKEREKRSFCSVCQSTPLCLTIIPSMVV